VKPVANFTFLFSLEHGFVRATFGEEAIWIFETNVFVELPEVDVIDLKTLQRLVELLQSGALGPAIKLGHDENFVAIAF
jgi:hypothetical protein